MFDGETGTGRSPLLLCMLLYVDDPEPILSELLPVIVCCLFVILTNEIVIGLL